MDKEWIKYWEEVENLEPDEKDKKIFDTKQINLQSAKDLYDVVLSVDNS